MTSEVTQLKLELADLRRESVDKIYQAVGLASSPLEDSGVPMELFEQEKEFKSTTPITDLVRRAEEEAWVDWQKIERERLRNAQLIHSEFHTID